MKDTISINQKSFHILNKLILERFYSGSISPNRFELVRIKFPDFLSTNNYRVIGTRNSEDRFELSFDYKSPMDLAVKFATGIGILFSIVSFLKGNWFLPIPFFILPALIVYIDFYFKKKKEINLFTSKFLEIYRSEFEN